MADHSACLREGRTTVRRRGQRRAEEALTATLEGSPVLQARRLRRATKTGAWLIVQLSTVNGTELGAQEWRNALFLQYGLEPPDLPTHCDGCQAKFLISHDFDCKKGGLVTARHNELRDELADLAGKAFTPPTCATTPSLLRSCREEYEGCASRGRRNQQPLRSAAARGHGTEGRPSYPGPLETGYRQCSLHACREH